MTKPSDSKPTPPAHTDSAASERKPYVRPAVEETAFETLALSCAGDNGAACPGPLLKS